MLTGITSFVTVLHNASINCHINVVEILLNNGADVSMRNGDGRTACDEAF